MKIKAQAKQKKTSALDLKEQMGIQGKTSGNAQKGDDQEQAAGQSADQGDENDELKSLTQKN